MLRTTKLLFVILFSFSILITGCKKEEPKTNAPKEEKTTKQLSSEVITQDKQKSLKPDAVLQSFKDGNKRFVENKLTQYDYLKQVHETSHGQYPEAIVLSCIDSRVAVELIFDKGIGDVFVARVAGNISNVDNLASMEYSCKVVGSKLILVLGHAHCGAVKAAIDDTKLGNITALLEKITPSVGKFPDYHGDKTSKNYEFVDMIGKENVKETIENIRKNSPILKEMEDKGEIKIAGAFYNIEDGKVEFLEK
jgi:carbonic anhydrase